nr:hypothetical protein PJ912_06745 [Pectobacterium colocasium]
MNSLEDLAHCIERIEFFHLELAELYLQYGADVHYLNFFSNSWLNYLYCPQERYTYTDEQRQQMLDLLLRYGLDLIVKLFSGHHWKPAFRIEIVMYQKDVSLLEHIFRLDIPIHFAETGIFERLFNYKSEWLPLPLFQQIVKRAGGSAYREPGVILSEDKKSVPMDRYWKWPFFTPRTNGSVNVCSIPTLISAAI